MPFVTTAVVTALALATLATTATADTPADTTKAAAGASKAKAWNVDDPPGPHSDVPIDTDEGTWMSVDVSPDGREVVFDLLGDLYVVAMTGGDARSLTRGVAWD
jgi:hypothetical protein